MDSGKIIEEHGWEYYRCEIDGQKYPVSYELIRPFGFDYRIGAKENPGSTSTRGPRLHRGDYVQQLGYYVKGYTKNFCSTIWSPIKSHSKFTSRCTISKS